MPALLCPRKPQVLGGTRQRWRQKLVETGAVDVMIDIRSNSSTREPSLPALVLRSCEGERRSPARPYPDARCAQPQPEGHTLHLRLQPEQQQNIAAVVWLYRGQSERFLGLVEGYLSQALVEGQATAEPLSALEGALRKLTDLGGPFATEARDPDAMAETWEELTFTPNPPKDTDGRREDSGRGVRELQGRWPGSIGVDGRSADGLQSAAQGPYGRLRKLRCADGRE